MSGYQDLKKIWKKLGIKCHIKNYSSKALWVLETDTGKPIAHILKPRTKSPPKVDADAFKRRDGKAIDGHKFWWKVYDISNVEVFDLGNDLVVSAVTKTALKDDEFGKDSVTYNESEWGVSIRLVTDIRRDKKRRIVAYHVNELGWLSPSETLAMTCNHEIDNARPVFPNGRTPYIRTRRDQALINNLETMGLA